MKKDWNYWAEFYKDYWMRNIRIVFQAVDKYTPIERIAHLVLIDLQREFGTHNLSIFPQQKIGPYRVDFLLEYRPLHSDLEKRIVVECDGHQWHERTKEQAIKDKERDRYLTREGYIVLRFTGSEIVDDPFKVWSDITQILIPSDLKKSFGFFGKEVSF